MMTDDDISLDENTLSAIFFVTLGIFPNTI
jgi:hypothetical protein